MFRKLSVVLLVLIALSLTSPALAASPTPGAKRPTPTVVKLAPPKEAPATGINVNISPPYINLVTDPGESISSEFKIRNNNNFREYFKITLRKFEVGNSDSGVVMSDINSGDEFASWISFEPQEFTVDPNQTKTVEFKINPPDDAALGYYYAAVISRISDADVSQGAAITAAASVPILLNVRSDNAKREIKILDFKTSKLFYEYLPTEFQLEVENSGNVHVSPVGDIFIDSMFEKETAVLPLNSARGNILPGGKRVFSVNWDDGMVTRAQKMKDGQPVKNSKGENEYETKFDFDKPLSTFRIGKYTAHVLAVYDNGERDIPLEATVSFWVIPWKLILGVIGVILAPFVLFTMISKVKRRLRS